MSYQSMLRDAIAVVAIFAFVGLGLGITGYISINVTVDLYGGGGGQFAQTLGQLFIVLVLVQSMIIAFFLGPVVAGLAGVFVGSWADRLTEALAVGGVGSLVGFYPMIVLAVYLTAAAMDGAGAGQVPTQTEPVIAVSRVIVLGVPTGIVGLLSSGVVFWRSY